MVHNIAHFERSDKTFDTAIELPDFFAFEPDWSNSLVNAGEWVKQPRVQRFDGFAKIMYEFDANSSLVGYAAGAFTPDFRRIDAQMAAYFTYTPSAVAVYNPGGLVHFLNIDNLSAVSRLIERPIAFSRRITRPEAYISQPLR